MVRFVAFDERALRENRSNARRVGMAPTAYGCVEYLDRSTMTSVGAMRQRGAGGIRGVANVALTFGISALGESVGKEARR